MAGQVDDIRTTEIVLRLMEHLSGIWPERATVDPASIDLADRNQSRRFMAAMEALNAQGYTSYERLVIEGGVPRFESAAITPSGRASLQAIRFFQSIN